MKRNLSTPINSPYVNMSLSASSMAFKNGISTKQNNSIGSIGLNPNLNIEDEYIENLLKQIHFMNMEVKLIKQKQSMSDGNALWGIINRTNMPMVNNIVQSSQKYQNMRKNVDSHLHKLETDIAGLQNSHGALNNQINFLQAKGKQIECKINKWDQQCLGKHKQLDEKILNSQSKLKNIGQQIQKEKKKNKQLLQSESKTIVQDQIDRSKQKKQNLQIQNDETIQQMIQRDLVAKIAMIKIMTAGLVKTFEENPDYIKAKQQQKLLKDKVLKLEQEIAGANFQIMQVDQSIKMAEVEKDKQVRQRKLLTQQYEQKKTMLLQIGVLNQVRKDKQAQARKKNSVQVSKAQEQSTKLQKNLQQIKKKLIKSQQSNCVLANQIFNYNRQLSNLQTCISSNRQKLNNLKKTNQQADTQLNTIKNQMHVSQSYYDSTLRQATNTSLDLFQLQRELQNLRGRKELLIKNIKLQDVIKQLREQDLQKLQKAVNKNIDLNKTVQKLKEKWDQITSFSGL